MTDSLPLVTILMPIRNEAAFIERSLGAVLEQDYDPHLLEVIVIDGMSTDGTREIVRRVIDRMGPHKTNPRVSTIARLLDNPSFIVPPGLNIGLRQARGNVIIRIDGHCQVAKDYVRRCVAALMRTDADCVGGPIITLGETLTARAIAMAQSSFFGVGAVDFRRAASSPRYVDTVAFGAYRRQVFDKIGVFDEEMVRNQDDELNYRLIHAGGRILLDPSIRVTYYNRGTIGRLWRQYFEYGLWKVRVMQKHPRQMRLRHFVPALFVAAVCFGAMTAPFSRAILYMWSLLLALYASAMLVSSVSSARRRPRRAAPLVCLSYLILHFSYGFGFLLGLIKFSRPPKSVGRRRVRQVDGDVHEH